MPIVKLRAKEYGFTLIELLVTFAILGFIITAIYTFYLAGLQSWNRSIDHLEYQQSARIGLDKIISEIRYAHQVEIRHGDRQMIYFRSNHKGKDTLFRFRLAGNSLNFDQRDNYDLHYSTNVIALNIKELNFIIDDSNTVLVEITAGEGSKEIFLSGSVRPRNLNYEME